MMSKKSKQPFEWQKGSKLSSDNYDHVGQINEVGFSKLADGLYADPVLRKEIRKKKLSVSPGASDVVVEESSSGLHQDYTPTGADRLIGRDTGRIKGVLGFSKDKNKKKS